MIVDAATQPTATVAQDGPAYPLGGFIFTGNPEVLIKLQKFASGKGIVVDVVVASDGTWRLQLPPQPSYGQAFIDVFNEAQSGRLGALKFGIVTGSQTASPK